MTVPLPAGWSPSTSVLGDRWAALPAEVREAALSGAVRTLWALSGRQFGTVQVTLAPYVPAPRRTFYDVPPRAVALHAATRSADNGAGCGGWVRAFRLPGPVTAVAEVLLDGAALPGDAWACDPDGTLVRTDGGGWPVAQDVYAPRWVVRYTRGREASDDANLAAGRYALELALGMTADPGCRLPARTRDVARQGISVSIADPTELADAGLTGIAVVDAWLRSVNPDGLDRAASVWGAGTTRHRVLAVGP
jgi:hypothetical protein